MQRRPLLIVCFLPDPGHVLPLLRLGRLLERQLKCPVVCLLAGNYEAMVRDYGFEYCHLRSVSTEWLPEMAARLSKQSIFFNAFSNYMDLSDLYWTPLRESVSKDLHNLVGTLRTIKPQLVLCDSNVFLDWYERLALCCGARLIINRAEGTLRWRQRTFVQTYGMSDLPDWARHVVEKAGLVSRGWFRFWRALRHAGRRRRVAKMQKAAAESAAMAFKDCSAWHTDTSYVTSGLAVLETQFATFNREHARIDEFVLPPIVETNKGGLPKDLAEWLDRQVGKVVYVCFGTMVGLSGSTFVELVRGLMDTGVSVLWSLPASQHFLLSKYPPSERFRVETFVQQRAVLASEKVGCFVTHGGGGGAQEAVVFGKPVLCIPFMWDQPYNCSLLIRLGLGRTLSKRRIKARRISREIRELLSNPMYTESARRSADEVRELQDSERQSECLRQLLAQPSPNSARAPLSDIAGKPEALC